MNNKVNHPKYYGGDVVYEAVKVIEAWELGFHLGNAVKYICRAGKKPDTSELEDLQKAEWYLVRRIAQLVEARGPEVTDATSVNPVYMPPGPIGPEE